MTPRGRNRRRDATDRRGGFTLLEVLVAVAILALALTAIFASEAGAVRLHHRARKVTVATLLARCKMGEIEELLLEEGLPAVEKRETDGCCEDGEHHGFTCDWSVTGLELEGALEGPEEGGLLDELDPAAEGGPDGPEGNAGDLAQGTSMQDVLSGATATGGGGDIMGQLAMQYAYPVLMPAIEQQVRLVEVTVRWNEGDAEKSFDVAQYYVAETPAEPNLGGGSIDEPEAP